MTNSNDFDAAKAIADQLQGMEKERQQRVLRWVAESLDLVLHVKTTGHEHPAGKLAHPAADQPDVVAVATSDIKTFVESKKPKSDVQFAAVVAYYYRFTASPSDRKDAITAEVLQDATRLCGRSRLTKPLKTLGNAKTLGYLDSADRGSFRINTVGENLVVMTLPGNAEAKRPVKHKAAPKRRAKSKARR